MSVERSELHELVDQLPDHEVAGMLADARRRLVDVTVGADWRPEFFGIVDGTGVPADVADNVDLYLAGYGFGHSLTLLPERL
ncbi:MAG: hypothetical protein QM582_06590 [Micropruina sp.]|uniref:hypothetical protein n=1 Tax=Micropruina sp. TaxID=2737536 RepID=UPI0039E44236